MRIVQATRFVASAVLALVLVAFAAPAPAENGTFTDCLMGCVPGDTLCIDCCGKAFRGEAAGSCSSLYTECFHRCESLEGTRAVACFKECQQDLRACGDKHPTDSGYFHCPNWVAPRDCPHECQAWSPTSRRCVGAPREVCD